METAATLLDFVWWWGLIGAIVAGVFLTIGIDRIDEDARGAYVFRTLLIPGILVIWPLVLWRWWVLEAGRDNWAKRHAPPRRAHGKVAIAMAIAIPLIIIVALSLRQTWPADYEPQRLSAPEPSQ